MALSMPKKLALALSAAAILSACNEASNGLTGTPVDSLAVNAKRDTVIVDVKGDSIVVNGGSDSVQVNVGGDTILVNVGGDTININIGTDPKTDKPASVTTLLVKVLDARTGAPLAGAKVQRFDGKAAETRENGTCAFDSVLNGALPLEVRLQGYETILEDVQIQPNEGKDQSSKSVLATLRMHKIGATLKGKLVLASRNPSEGLSPAADVSLELRLPGKFVAGYRTAKTDANGDYSFADLPEYSEYAITVLPRKIGSNLYGGQALAPVSGNLAAGEPRQLPTATLTAAPSGSLYLVSAPKGEWQPGKKFTIWFSDRIDTAALEPDAVRLLKDGVPIAIRFNWEDVTAGLSVQPFQGEWPAGELSIWLKGFTDRGGNPLSGTSAPVVVTLTAPLPAGGLKVDSIWLTSRYYSPYTSSPVDTNVVDYNTTDYTLHWNRVEGADAYEVYSRETPASVWVLTRTVYEDTSAAISYPTPAVYKPLTRSHMIVARSGIHRGEFSQAPVLVLKDGLGPNLAQSYYNQFQFVGPATSFNNSYSDTALKVRVRLDLRSNYNAAFEPLDTARTVGLSMEKNSYYGYYGDSKVFVSSFAWVSTTSAIIEFTVPPREYPYYYTLTLDFSRMTDLSGNRVWSSSGKPVLVYTLSN